VSDPEATEPARPLLRVLTPGASAEEVAAVVAVFAALGGAEPVAPRRTPEWSRPARGHRLPVSHGPGGWRSSALPR